MNNRIKIALQYLAPQRALSWLSGVLCHCRWVWWKNWQINLLIRCFGADMSTAQCQQLNDYPDFNSFFTRRLNLKLRPIAEDKQTIVSPVDGAISQIGKIENTLLFQAKGFYFNTIDLLGGSADRAKPFASGYYATLYLAPKDYHRVHMPYAGTLREAIYIPGKLFSVNTLTTQHIPHLFSRNERLVCLFDTDQGPMAVILVGAMLVSGIKTIWSDAIIASAKIKDVTPTQPISLEKGEELGHFEMGSTVIVLFTANQMAWSRSALVDTDVKMGQALGSLHSQS